MAKITQTIHISPVAKYEVERFAKESHLSEPLKKYYLQVFKVISEKETASATRNDIISALENAGLPSSKPYLTKRLQQLIEMGVATEFKGYVNSKRVDQVKIESLKPFFQKAPETQPIVKPGRPSRQLLEIAVQQLELDSTYLDLGGPPQARIDRLICVLDSSTRMSGKDDRKVIKAKYQFKPNDYVIVTATTSSEENSGIMTLSDQRVMRAINAIVFESIESQYGRIDNLTDADIEEIISKQRYFVFDIFQLCHRIGLSSSTRNNRNLVHQIMLRLRDTAFEVDATNSPYFKEAFSQNADIDYYRYITEYKAKKLDQVDDETGEMHLEERYYRIKLHESIMYNLLKTARSFICHPELLHERSGLAHRLNNWCKAFIGVRAKPGSAAHIFTLPELQQKLLPSVLIANFRRDFLNLMERQCENYQPKEYMGVKLFSQATKWAGEEGVSVAWLYGYYVKIEWDEQKYIKHCRMRRIRRRADQPPILVSIWRDKTDYLIGDDSNHNQAFRRQLRKYQDEQEQFFDQLPLLE